MAWQPSRFPYRLFMPISLKPPECRKPVYLENQQHEEGRHEARDVGGRADQHAHGGYGPDGCSGRQALHDPLLSLKDDSSPQEANAGDDALDDAVTRYREASDGDAGKGGSAQRDQSEGTHAGCFAPVFALEAHNETKEGR